MIDPELFPATAELYELADQMRAELAEATEAPPAEAPA